MQKYIVFDIDGTLSLLGDRKKCLEKGNWVEFYQRCDEDTPNRNIIYLLNMLIHSAYCVSLQPIFCTGRSQYEGVVEKTIAWLEENTAFSTMYFRQEIILNFNLFMRKAGDIRPDVIVKPELLKNAGILPKDTISIFEDRNKMVQKWRELGYTCVQVAEGDF
jgi:hypothetical protein